ncbi:uncharacterized protein LOC110831032 isoform X2 [Zootermopsis nevadensis]|uniref:uncharacterized protein LOC110831032 isoform X2 n=1 Tax=Zootermopsis nevadensis TaxID=136037 RepID=UPI000B8E6F7D|nr:uncharacterized protein LOC110831032 isoform X2 [Zootermopsis nevadensis]
MLERRFKRLALLPATVFLLYLPTVVRATAEMTEGPEVAVQNVFRQILKLRPPNEPLSTAAKVFTPPKHMLELYQKYAAGGGPKRTTGSTVRSILPTKGYNLQHASSTSPSDLLIFNVTCMEQTEEVHLAQLHLHRRRLPRHHHSNHYSRRVLLPPYRVRLYQILQARRTPGRARSSPPRAQNARPTRARTMLLASVPVPQATRGGWHALDITPVLRELLLNAQGPVADLMLGVRFEAPKGRPISPEHFLRDPDDGNTTKNNVAAPAFLVVFSEDGSDNGLMDDSGETQLQTPPSHTHAMAKMLQTAGGDFLKGVKSVPKHPLTIKDTEINISNKTRNDDFYIEASDNGHENNEVDASLRQNHKSKTPKGNRTHVDEDGNSIDFGNHQIHARKDPLQEKKRTVLRRRMYLKTKIHSSEDKFDSKKRNLKESNKKPYVSETNEVELAAGERSPHRRVVRSILDNELPDEYPRPTKSVPRTSPGTLLQGRRNGNVAHGKDDANTIPLPPGGSAASNGRWRGGRRRRRGRGKKRGEHKKRSRKLPENWQHVEQDEHWRQNDAELDSSSGAGEGVPTCRRHKLEVKFADIGWSDWIISPQTFEAHYCAGSCPFPLTKALKPTNHATIQSLVHAIGMQPDVPAPCCVPDHLSPMTLLYMDDAGNVVLKNYPAMSVDTCSCR